MHFDCFSNVIFSEACRACLHCRLPAPRSSVRARDQTLDGVLSPFLLAVALEAGLSEQILAALARPIRQMSQFHRPQTAVDDHRGAQSRSKAEQKHLAALIASDRL